MSLWVGPLIFLWWDLSVLQVLLSVSIKGGIIILLVGSMQIVAAEPSRVERCGDTMNCFAPKSCKTGTDHKLVSIDSGDLITGNCKAILKIRAYSKNKYYVVLESRDLAVKEITLAEDTPQFSCKAASGPQYKGKSLESIEPRIDSPFKCEFIVEESNRQNEIARFPQDEIVMSTNNGFESKGKEHQIQYGSLIAFCDPSQAVYDSQSADSKIIKQPIIGLTHFSCQEDYHIETRRKINNQLEPEFMGTTSIVCEKESTEYKFVIKRKGEMIKQERNEDFNIRCAKRTVGQQASATSPIAIVVIVGGSIILLAVPYITSDKGENSPAPPPSTCPLPGIAATSDNPLFDQGVDPSLWTEEHKAMLRQAAKRDAEREAREDQSFLPICPLQNYIWSQVSKIGKETLPERAARLRAAQVAANEERKKGREGTTTGGNEVKNGRTPVTKVTNTSNDKGSKDITVDKVKENFGKTDRESPRKLLPPESTQVSHTTGTTGDKNSGTGEK